MAGGISESVIAYKLGICRNALRKHFADELVFGRDLKRAENLKRLEEAAEGGNVAAMKHLDGRFSERDTAAQPQGKKEQRAAQAEETAVGSFATPAAPKLVVDNQ